jgi:hypothetical protein
MTKWYSIVVGVILVLVGLDPWLPTGPEVMVMPIAGVATIVVGLVGIVLGALELKGKAPAKTPSATPPAMPAQ